MVTNKIKHKKLDGTILEADIGALAANITQDASHRFTTDAEKVAWNAKAERSIATTSANGLMSSADKKKLDGVATGAQVNTITGIKGNAESTYRSGNVNLTPANIGAAATNHTHNYAGSGSVGGAATSALACTGNSATATKATQDSAGQQINTTYIKGLSVSGKTITYTKGNGTTSTIITQDTTYTHPTSSGNKHIPSGGSSGQFLKWSADGTAVWAADNNTTYSNMTGATASATGKSGLVPAPATGAQTKYLRGDGTWQTPPNTTYSVATTTANGLMGAADKKLLGNTDISNIGNGTVTGAVSQLNSNLSVIGAISAQVTGTVNCGKSTGTTTNLVSTWLAAGTYIIKGVISASPSADGLLMYQLYNETSDNFYFNKYHIIPHDR